MTNSLIYTNFLLFKPSLCVFFRMTKALSCMRVLAPISPWHKHGKFTTCGDEFMTDRGWRMVRREQGTATSPACEPSRTRRHLRGTQGACAAATTTARQILGPAPADNTNKHHHYNRHQGIIFIIIITILLIFLILLLIIIIFIINNITISIITIIIQNTVHVCKAFFKFKTK